MLKSGIILSGGHMDNTVVGLFMDFLDNKEDAQKILSDYLDENYDIKLPNVDPVLQALNLLAEHTWNLKAKAALNKYAEIIGIPFKVDAPEDESFDSEVVDSY